MKTEYITLKETTLTNNCPECYSTDGMVLSFKQQMTTSKFLIKTKSNVVENIFCTKCENEIFPGQWTLDIERVYNYHKKTIPRKKGSIQFTKPFYFVTFILLAILIAIGVYLFDPTIFGL
ncbi:hypothetical protein [Aquimarina pacifica]|uniref:hypothetical protein n=1 Tax=Aquimarina pacifica TaxID=1296415 RepID=UPI0004703DBA|nr:hypothetical protein [Aquimarina pacifica]